MDKMVLHELLRYALIVYAGPGAEDGSTGGCWLTKTAKGGLYPQPSNSSLTILHPAACI